jgi:hypothetical protein
MYPSRLADFVREIVAVEGPVHKEIIIQRITKGAGLKRAGNRIRAAIQKAIRYAVKNDFVRDSKDGFIWGTNQNTPPLRNRSNVGPSEKKLEMAAKQEIKMAFEKVIPKVFSIKYKDAVTEVLARLGFRRVTADTRKRAELVLDECISKGKITRNGDFLSLRK